jgi:hypothetical protein
MGMIALTWINQPEENLCFDKWRYESLFRCCLLGREFLLLQNIMPTPLDSERVTTADTWCIRTTLEEFMWSANTSFSCLRLGT